MKNIRQNIYVICLAIFIATMFLFGRSCGSNNTSKTDLQTHTDTLIVHKTDTIMDTTKVFIFKYIKPKTKDSSKVILDSSLFKGLSYKRMYNSEFRDSNIVINTIDTTIGYLTSKQIKYKLLVPLRIYDSTTIKITKDTFIYKPYKYEIHGGVIVGTKLLSPTIDLSINRSTYMLGYDPFNKQPIIGFKYRLIGWTPKKRK